MRVLGIDLGLKRTGCAVSDETGVYVRVLPNIVAVSQKAMLDQVVALCETHEVGTVVVGLPQNLTPQSQAICKRSHSLVARLKEVFSYNQSHVKVFQHEESYTSKTASKNLSISYVPKTKRKKMLDGESAAVLIEDFCRQQESSTMHLS